jgi:hypothetical protein
MRGAYESCYKPSCGTPAVEFDIAWTGGFLSAIAIATATGERVHSFH